MAGDKSKYYDANAAIQVIGCVINNPSILEKTDTYSFAEDDFAEELHRIIFGAIYNLVTNGSQELTPQTIDDYLGTGHERSWSTYKSHNGREWFVRAFQDAEPANFDYHYGMLKKMSLLRAYENVGLDLSWIYDPDNITDLKEKQRQQDRFESMSLQELAEEIDNRVHRVKEIYVDNDTGQSGKLGDGILETIERMSKTPARGVPLYDNVLNQIAMGARRGTFYLRSAGTGTGKSRSAMADACYMSCSEIYENGEWIQTPCQNHTLFISVELDEEELRTMAVSFVAGIPEDHILEGTCDFEERQRIIKACEIIDAAPLWFEYLPDYNMKDIENCIYRNNRENKCTIIFLDYITSSMRIIEEVARAAGGAKIREDQILFLLSSKLKDIAGKRQLFIFSSTQLNQAFKTEKIPDQTLLAGAKAIANRVDFGSIMLDCTQEDIDDIRGLAERFGTPNVKMSIYKNRRGKTNRVLLWMRADKGTSRFKTLFVTDYAMNLIPLSEIYPNVPDDVSKPVDNDAYLASMTREQREALEEGNQKNEDSCGWSGDMNGI